MAICELKSVADKQGGKEKVSGQYSSESAPINKVHQMLYWILDQLGRLNRFPIGPTTDGLVSVAAPVPYIDSAYVPSMCECV